MLVYAQKLEYQQRTEICVGSNKSHTNIMIVNLKMNKQDLLYTNLPQYKFKNSFLYMLLFKLLQFIKPLEFCLNKLEIF